MATPPRTTANPDEFVIGVEGDDVAPEHFDVMPSLRFFVAYVQLMQTLAKAEQRVLDFTGLRVLRGSAAFAYRTDDIRVAEQTAERAQLYLVGGSKIPRGLQTQVSAVQDALQQLPEHVTPFYEAHERRHPLPKLFAAESTLVEYTDYRGVVRLVGGIEPRVVLAIHDGDLTHLSLHASEALVQRAAKHLYKAIDATVRITWRGERVESAGLEDFTPVEEGLSPAEEAARWREWFAVAGSSWNDVEDIEAELRGDAQ